MRQLYLSDLQRHVRRDQEDYAAALKRCNGLTPVENSKLYAQVWSNYYEKPLGLKEVVEELGVKEEEFLSKLKAYSLVGGDPVLVGLLAKPPITIRREHWEEVYHLAQKIMR